MSGDVTVHNNGRVTVGGGDRNATFLSGGNTSKASFKDTSNDPFGITGAGGFTYGVINHNYNNSPYPLPHTGRVLGHLYHRWTPILRGNWNGSYAVGITAGGSFAYKDCNGFTKVAGSGNISHGTYATNRRGSFAYTSGNSAYSYNGRTHDDSIVGGGVAVTGGYSGISTSGTTTSLFAVSGSTAATGVTRSVFNFPSCGGCY